MKKSQKQMLRSDSIMKITIKSDNEPSDTFLYELLENQQPPLGSDGFLRDLKKLTELKDAELQGLRQNKTALTSLINKRNKILEKMKKICLQTDSDSEIAVKIINLLSLERE